MNGSGALRGNVTSDDLRFHCRILQESCHAELNRVGFMLNQQIQFLVTYDICNAKRLLKVHRLLKKQGFPVQYSVFSVITTKKRIRTLLDDIQQLIDSREDDIRCYTLPDTVDCQIIGRQVFPEDIALFSKGVAFVFV